MTEMIELTQEEILERLLQADVTPAELARQLGRSLSDLARWAGSPENLAQLEAIARLEDLRAQAIVCRHRATAAARLIETAANEGKDARRASVDLLKVNLKVFEPRPVPPAQSQAPVPTREDVQAAMERLFTEPVEIKGP